MILGSEGKRPDIDYPCEWGYKIIGEDIDRMLNAIRTAVDGYEYELTPSNISTRGKYLSLNLKVTVANEIQRDRIFTDLQDDANIRFVL